MKEKIKQLEEYLENDDFENIDNFLHEIYSFWYDDVEISKIDDILTEATLYIEFKEAEYKEEALKLINIFLD